MDQEVRGSADVPESDIAQACRRVNASIVLVYDQLFNLILTPPLHIVEVYSLLSGFL